jgi:hypothetical protein
MILKNSVLALLIFLSIGAFSQNNIRREVQYLSGTDNENIKTWDSYCIMRSIL